jgi:hypothetical protein
MKLIHFMSFQELLDGYCLLRVDTVTRVSLIRGFQLLQINVLLHIMNFTLQFKYVTCTVVSFSLWSAFDET